MCGFLSSKLQLTHSCSRRIFSCNTAPSTSLDKTRRRLDMNASHVTTAPPAIVHVLAVDDDPSMRQMIADYLGDNDIRVTTLATGREIADVMSRDTIDLLIL